MIGDQLSLDLKDPLAPWNGVSPRYLTKGSQILSLASEGASRSIQDADGDPQLELFPEEKSDGTQDR